MGHSSHDGEYFKMDGNVQLIRVWGWVGKEVQKKKNKPSVVSTRRAMKNDTNLKSLFDSSVPNVFWHSDDARCIARKVCIKTNSARARAC